MKIAILSFYSGQVERGVENWAQELTKRLSTTQRVTLFQAGRLANSIHNHIVDIKVDWQKRQSYSGLKRKLYLDYFSRKIAEFTKKVLQIISKDTDIIIPTNGGWQSILCKLYALKNNNKLIIVGHSGIGLDDYINLMVRPNYFIALTDYQKQWALNSKIISNVITIPNGIDVEKYAPQGDKISINLPRPIILLPSSIIRSKQIDKAIQAISQIPSVSLAIVGKSEEDSYKTEIKEMGSKLLKRRFLLTESSQNEMPQWYRACDIVTFPCLSSEAFGLVLLEALSSNKPVVTNNDPIRREIVGNAGILCNVQDTKEYTNALEKALNTNYKDLPRNQAQKFSWDKIANQYYKLFQ